MKKKIIRIIKRICFLPPIPTFIIAFPSFAFLIVTLAGKIHNPVLNGIAYLLSAYALTISVTGISKIVILAKNSVSDHPFMKWLLSMPIMKKLIHENRFRTEIALYPGFCINVLYVIFKTVTGIYYRSAWFISLGVYYLALAIMRFLLIHYIRFKKETSDKNDELRRYRMCGCMLFLINVALVGITILAVKKNAGFTYPGYLIYVMAMYAFYSVITAVINLVKYHKYGSPILSAAKVINMSTALVSFFSLETAMLAQFGSESTEHFRVMMTALTGAGVSLIVLGMAVFMIVRSGILIKKYGGWKMIHILVVDDDEKLNKTVCKWLNDGGFETKGVLNGNDAFDELYNSLYDLIISDIMMPGVDGFEFAEKVREVNKHIPILFVSAKDDLPSKQKGFQLGIDDYMVKPIELAELEMRVRALLRRANIEMERKLTIGNLVLDADAMTAEIDGEEIPVATRAFNILYKLLSYPKKTFTRAQLMDEFWGLDTDTSLRAVDVYITKIRDKFSVCDGFEIKTVRGLGYKAVLL